ncbi:MAG: putative cysteine ligase BshC [Bryobacteraceae bacterium]|nr:MAG: putative cysteine ligase BshC [Bryobacteraceae bacterium]
MRFASVPYAELPGVSALFAAYVSASGDAARFYRHDPFSLTGWLEAAREARAAEGAPRRDVAEALAAVNPQSAALQKLADPATVAVVTGQQAGLFGGPAYTLYKALTAVHVARRLEEAGQPAVPVFWIASEDHDLIEVSRAHVFDTRLRIVRLEAAAGEGRGRPVGTIPIPHPPVEALAAAMEGFLHADEALALVRDAYRPGRTFSESFLALLEPLLRPYGMVFLDPLEPRLRRLAAPLLERAWARREELGQALALRKRELEQAGFHAQVDVEDGTALFFVLEHGARRRAGIAAVPDDPAQWSPNALLRPVMQDWLLPTAVYVGGPAEVAYWAQSEALHSLLLGRMPAVLPRAGFTLIDPRTQRLMERFGVTLAECLRGEEALLEHVAVRLVPERLKEALDEAAAGIGPRLESLRAELAAFDPTLGEAMKRSGAKIAYQLEKMRRKTARAALRKSDEAADQARHAFRLAAPERQLQERYYSFLPFLAKYGTGVLDEILQAADAMKPAHEVLVP